MKSLKYWKTVSYCLVLCIFTVMSVGMGTVQAEVYFGDPFEGGELQNPNWNWQNEPPNWDLSSTRDGFLYMQVDDTSRNLWADDGTHLLYQEIDVDVFDVETHFFARWDANSGVSGIVVKSPADNNWVTVKFWSRDANARGQIQYQTKQNDSGNGLTGNAGFQPEYSNTELFLRLRKNGDEYTSWYKTEEAADWIEIGITTFALTPPLWLGIYVGDTDLNGGLEVEYEYFKDNLNATDVEPEGKVATTWGKVKSRY